MTISPEHKWVAEQQGRHICACGCGRPIKIIRQHRYARGIPQYVEKSHKKLHWIKGHKGKHFCQCGCGKPIEILPGHIRARGIPKFIRWHHSEVRKTRDAWVEQNQKKHICACGCERYIIVHEGMKYRGIAKFIHGHAKGSPLVLWVKQEQGKHICACGCGRPIPVRSEHRRHGLPKYILGHNSKGDNNPSFKGVQKWIKRIQGTTLCTCGCKQAVRVQEHHFYIGVPKFIHGHNSRGEDNPNWKGGVSEKYDRLRNSHGARKWRRAIYERDNSSCQMPNCQDPKGSVVHAHHVIGFSKDESLKFELWNGITLCAPCHYSVKGKEGELEEFFFRILRDRGYGRSI